MPDRVTRDELLESKRWLSLKDNADRLAYIALLLKADSLGNFSAEPFRLLRLWRDFGMNTEARVAKCLSELADHDLVRPYQVESRPYLHIPRFGQRTRYIKRVFPHSPWTTTEEKQAIIDNSPGAHRVRTAEVKRSEVKRSEDLTNKGSSELKQQRSGQHWREKLLKEMKGKKAKPKGDQSEETERRRAIAKALEEGDTDKARALRNEK